ncbi:MAG: class I SAM-dependent methyltransferase [Cyclobacteriaceae bacterium]
MTLKNIFLQSSEFSFQSNIFYQRGLSRDTEFETLYLSLREKENRVYPDEIVKILPEIPLQHCLSKEWITRKFTVHKLIRYLREKKAPKILEVGCGNGWLCHHLASIPGSEVVGMDVNETELLQGARVFMETKNLFFTYTDIGIAILPFSHFDFIILSASIQYFRDIGILLSKLLGFLARDGEIHIVDSPVYDEADVESAHKRTEEYFDRAGFPLMKKYYHHHTWHMLRTFNLEILYNPDTFLNKMRKTFFLDSPFPWIKIINKER